MKDTIVVGVALHSEAGRRSGQRAIAWAAERAMDRHQRLELLSIVGGAVGMVGEAHLIDQARDDLRSQLEAEARTLADAHPDRLDVRVRVDHGNPVAKLIDASKDAALLVIGSDFRGDAGPARGPHGIRIAAGSHAPVVVIPDADPGARSGVVVGVDGSDLSERAIAFAAAEADRLGEALITVIAWSPMEVSRNPGLYPPEYLDALARLSEESLGLSLAGLSSTYPDLRIERHVERGYPSEAIEVYARRARLTVLGSHGRGAIARFLLGSVSEEVLRRLPSAVAIVR
ncbi:universal stress protein [Microbacterium aurantiacum]|uniref:Universal stress protein n=1 Tax=Microbacterium aurantiacum TaxID=162393 RepID=A0ABT8FP48_9MICO|nr:universal stress protein [Microbacterium aurantiacum]MDN4463096.1 universal stress protein [Microbacterium aurantiacum]